MSNVLEIRLPLDVTKFRYPPVKERAEEEDLYQEYLEISEGAGYLSAMDGESYVLVMLVLTLIS